MRFNDMRVSHKLWGTILGLLLAMLWVTAWTQWRTQQVNQTSGRQVAQLEDAISTGTGWRGVAEMAASTDMDRVLSTDAAHSKLLEGRAVALNAKITRLQERLNQVAATPADQAALDRSTRARADLLGLSDKAQPLQEARDAEASQAFIDTDYQPRAVAYLDAIDQYLALQRQQRDAAQQATQAARDQVAMVALVSVVLVVLLGGVLSWRLARSITRPLQRAVAGTDAIAAGDLTRDLQDPRKDAFGHLLRSLGGMVATLRSLVAEVRSGVDAVATAAAVIALGNQDLSARTGQTAARLQQAAARMEALTSSVSQAADTARQAHQLAATAAQAAQRGGAVVAQVVVTLQHLSSSSKRMADTIASIDGIAFQTHILALNAAVDAARAGEQGRGFAVVASEMRSLAQRSADAAKEIKTLIGDSLKMAEAGTQQATLAAAAMGDIGSCVGRVSALIGEISAASSEQRDGIAQVHRAVHHLDQMTQQNAALVGPSAAAAAGLRDQAQRLAQVVSLFKLGGLVAPPSRPVPRVVAQRPSVQAQSPARPRLAVLAAKTLLRPVLAKPPAPGLRRPVALTAAKPIQPAAPAKGGRDGEGDGESF